jgi:cyclopropane fatty-acyl-phospholipid synthase-like methyltransferase
MVANWTVQSVLDVGCGRGISTSWFVTHGLRTECVEGSHDAIEKSMVPDKKILTEHDFARGPWWPGKTFDLVWSVEFLEHVSLHFHYNYVSSFRKAAIIVCTSSNWGGWHHVEVHSNDWWIRKYESYGFRYDQKLTDEIREIAMYEMDIFPPNGERLKPQHIFTTAKVFINPVRMTRSFPLQ